MSAAFDLAIVGAGPGGSACALAAARAGLSVALFEPQERPIDKPCGEGCLASGVRILEELGLGALVARGKVLRTVTYAMPGAPTLCIPLPEPGCALERGELAAALDACVAREPRVQRFRAAARVEPLDSGFRVESAGECFEARTLAAADGARGRAAGWLRGERWLEAGRFGVRARCEARAPLDGVIILLGDPALQVYVTPLPDERLNVALLCDRAPEHASPDAWLGAALALPELAALAGDVVTAPESRSLARRAPRAVARGGAFLVGDAAGGIDPVVGCGVSVALSTGVAAARGASELLSGRPAAQVERAYSRAVRRETAARAHLARALLFLARQPRCARAALRALARAPRLAEAIVRVAEG